MFCITYSLLYSTNYENYNCEDRIRWQGLQIRSVMCWLEFKLGPSEERRRVVPAKEIVQDQGDMHEAG